MLEINVSPLWQAVVCDVVGRHVASVANENFKAGDMDKITVVIWFEGDDPECVDDILEGEIKFSMDINVIEELDNGGEAA